MGKILIIDDNDDFRALLHLTLASFGHTVIEARNGNEGLAKFKQARVDLVITDMVMPEKDGLEVLWYLFARQIPPVKAIAITGNDRAIAANNLKMAKFMGAAKVLTKPISTEVLIATINELLPVAASKVEIGQPPDEPHSPKGDTAKTKPPEHLH
jgi:CheY-like chemotaxis protein